MTTVRFDKATRRYTDGGRPAVDALELEHRVRLTLDPDRINVFPDRPDAADRDRND